MRRNIPKDDGLCGEDCGCFAIKKCCATCDKSILCILRVLSHEYHCKLETSNYNHGPEYSSDHKCHNNKWRERPGLREAFIVKDDPLADGAVEEAAE